jgi:type VI secretion system protein ImpE
MDDDMTPEEYLSQGDLENALQTLQNQVRKKPAESRLRIFLFQMLAVVGEWDRALTQLNVAGELDDATLAMVMMYREVLSCEALREQVFEGVKEPVVFGDPNEWVALLIQALKLTAGGRDTDAAELRSRAFELAPESRGEIDGKYFAWIADGDSRLGPVLEVIVEGRYLWVPFDQIRIIQLEPPEDLRDLLWLPAHLTWTNGGESYGLIPARYPRSFKHVDPKISLCRKTEWEQQGEDTYIGYGQRTLMTDQSDYALMDIRLIKFTTDETDREKVEEDG